MGELKVSLLLAILGLSAEVFCSGGSSDEAPPMVAFMCGKPAMHLTQDGWQNDQQTDCLDNARDILDYCKQMYPDQDIKNVVEASKKVTIDNWCKAKHTHCRHHGSHTVRPFKCLVGPFQSEALLVPDHCVFDHFHDVTACKTFQQWNETSQKKCEGRNMKQQSFAILLPCQVDMFAGVEFVCCPRDDVTAVSAEEESAERDEVDGKQS